MIDNYYFLKKIEKLYSLLLKLINNYEIYPR